MTAALWAVPALLLLGAALVAFVHGPEIARWLRARRGFRWRR